MSTTVEIVETLGPELAKELAALVPQLSSSAAVPSPEVLAEVAGADSNTLFVARSDDRVVGMLTLVTYRIPTGLNALIEDVVVDQAARGEGAGGALVEAALSQARHLGARHVDLTSRPSREAANRLYKKMGFVERETNVYRFDLAG